MIYVDTSVALAQLLAEDRRPPTALWRETLVASRLLEYELWTRLHARKLTDSHGDAAQELLRRIALLELSPTVLSRALEAFPIPVRTLDALHLASCEFLRSRGQSIELASYDSRMLDAARAMELPLAELERADVRTEIDRLRAKVPRGAHSVLLSRTLATSHRRLGEILQPGMSVLDVGCGTGAITVGIAERVRAEGRVVGVDADESLIAEARRSHRRAGLSFEVRDAYDLGFTSEFDVVTSSRVLQWLAKPRAALSAVIAACRPGGLVLVLDYNHEKVRFEPSPPSAAARFYEAFLTWRADAGMSNVVADRLEEWFREAGLGSVAVTPQHEVTRRGDADFDEQILLWSKVAHSRGVQMVADGYLTEAERALAEKEFRSWAADSAVHQKHYLLCVEGVAPQR